MLTDKVKRKVSKKSKSNSVKPQIPVGKGRKPSIPVENAWGTMRATTPTIVLNAIKRVATSLNSLTVKRKYHTHDGVTKRWWFVVHGNKTNIELLESEWGKIETQTGWKLQPLLSFADTTATVSNNTSNSPIVLNNGAVATESSDTTATCANPQSPPATVSVSNSTVGDSSVPITQTSS